MIIIKTLIYASNLRNSTLVEENPDFSKEQFRLSQINGFSPDGYPIHKLTCVFEDFSNHVNPCVEWEEFTKLGYGYNNIYYDEYWHNITHRKGLPCMCMCKNTYESINGNCLKKSRMTKEKAQQHIKHYGFFPAAYFIMAKFNSLYYIPGLFMSMLYVCLLLQLFNYKNNLGCDRPLTVIVLVCIILILWIVLIAI